MPETNPQETATLSLIDVCRRDLLQERQQAYTYSINFTPQSESKKLKEYIESEKFQAILETWQNKPGVHYLSCLPEYANENLPNDRVLIYIDDRNNPTKLYISYKTGEFNLDLQDPGFLEYIQLIRDNNLTFMDNESGTTSMINDLFVLLRKTPDKHRHARLIKNFMEIYNHQLLITYTENDDTLKAHLKVKDTHGGKIYSLEKEGPLLYQPSSLSKHLATANDLWKKPETKAAVAAAGTAALGAAVITGLILKSVM